MIISRKKELSTFYLKLGELQRSGIPIREGLILARADMKDEGLRSAIKRAEEALDRGKSLAEGLSRSRGVFPELDVALIRVGESGGRLDESLARIAALRQSEHRDLAKLLFALAYPTFLLGSAILLPPLGVWFRDGLFAYLATVTKTTLYFALPIGGIIGAYVFLKKQFPHATDERKLGIPVLGRNLRKLAAARFARTLAALIEAGVEMRTSLRLAVDALGNRFLVERARAAERVLERGGSLVESLHATNVFPEETLQMLAVGERSGEVPKMLNKVAAQQEHEARQVMTALLAATPVVLYLLVAAYIAYTVISFYTGMYGAALK